MTDTTASLQIASKLSAEGSLGGSPSQPGCGLQITGRAARFDPKRKTRIERLFRIAPTVAFKSDRIADSAAAGADSAESVGDFRSLNARTAVDAYAMSVDYYPIDILISDVATTSGNVVIATVMDQMSRQILGVKVQYLRSSAHPPDSRRADGERRDL